MVAVSVVGISFIGALVLTASAGVFLVLSPAFLLAQVAGAFVPSIRRLFTFVQQLVQGMWLGNCAILMEKWQGIQVQIFLTDGEHAQKDVAGVLSGERAIWLSNHRTRLDWMLLWSFGLRIHSLHQLKIILKSSLKNVPIFGWAMQAFEFIFLTRHWQNDQAYLKDVLAHLTATAPNASYLLFPEGTDLSESNLVKSNDFAATKGKPARQFTLYPRTTGWTHIVPLIRHEIDAVYDLTMCFVDRVPGRRANEAELIAGAMPKAMNIFLRRYPISDLPSDTDGLNAWMEARYAEKEALLVDWYTHGRLPAGATPILDHELSSTTNLIQAFWVLLCSVLLAAVYTYSAVRLYVAAICVVHFALAKFTPGIDRLLMRQS
ncbi:lysocardiolipin acyltransferase [Achlya hypogyna]|uniref:Lysocardiolipin acyltransferase n=1 Tax=Achlya hypogyna TaxID=1202772 RepID=A0A1V9Y5N8_ACHHY|nr:lysocardiolipin acyltransferase [Achlya hypogyna]